ncbi:MAG: sugar phosphate nucleotidyltransferase [candidate division KSB1 bacterium]|nr:sugar phosphate nucleotidyltransferase [candidate division KSB1 bacterium]MDZ7369344.1 sugar phosphate nucleotidyltransferase [candidate division KSB1 bacterium]MDZ7407401.1 sugar phosphate nucleotidyltransferase [candidate division KSB1 bacterium]
MKAIILAGGLGTRLRPITLSCPKPLLPIGNRPLLHRLVFNLRAYGVREFIFLLHYQPQRFIDALGDGQRFEAQFHYVVMEKDLGTAGSVKFAAEHITETTLIYSGDILAELPLRRMLVFHQRRGALVTLALHAVSAPLPYGLVLRDSDGRLRRFFEKPTWPQVFSDWINASIYLIEPGLLQHIPGADRPILFEQEVFPPLAASGAKIFGFPISGYWRDVGTPEDLRLANMDYLHGRLPKKMLTPEELTSHDPTRGTTARRGVVGHRSQIAPDAHLEASVIGADCRIDSHAKIHGAVVFDGVHLGKGVQVNNAILMSGVEVEAKAEIHHNAVVAEKAHIGAAAIVAANAIVRNTARVACGATVSAKRVLPTGYLRRFVDGGSLLGSVKGGMSTDFMRWVGKTFAWRQRQHCEKSADQQVLLATQEEELFNTWSKALAQGILSTGCDVHLLESVTLPAARWALQNGRYLGGIYLSTDRHAELIRLALIHPTAEDFTTEESCSLERIDLLDAPKEGNLRIMEAAPIQADYLSRLLQCVCATDDSPTRRQTPVRLAPQAHAVLHHAVPIRAGVVGQATARVVEKFFNLIGCSAEIEMFPIDMSADFRRHTRAAQKAFVQSLTDEVGLGVWIGGTGERLQLALPGSGLLPRGSSDALVARLLMEEDPTVQLVAGWLFPHFSAALQPRIRRYEGCMLTTACLRSAPAGALMIGFDGRGAIAFPPPALESGKISHPRIAYPDAVMAMAFLLRALGKISRGELLAKLCSVNLGYRLMPCPDEAKAYLMRRLVESYSHLAGAFSDGIRLQQNDSSWIVIRPCAGMEALEIYWEENPDSPARQRESGFNSTVRRQLAHWRKTHAPTDVASSD